MFVYNGCVIVWGMNVINVSCNGICYVEFMVICVLLFFVFEVDIEFVCFVKVIVFFGDKINF